MSRLAHLGTPIPVMGQRDQLSHFDEVGRLEHSPDRAAEQDGVLENDGQSRAQCVQGQFGNIYPIYDYLSCYGKINATDMLANSERERFIH